ncbi:MAG: diguanylate cyclase [Bacteroidales bacterium]|nr:diguanylate cyclase [Bacteroidales bacterium]
MAHSRYLCSVLVVDDEPSILALLTGQLGQEFAVHTASSVSQAQQWLQDHPIDIVVSDLHLADRSGIQLLDWVQQHKPRAARVLLTGTASVEDTVEAINNSRIHRLILKPWRADDLLMMLRQVARGLLLERSHEELLEELRRLNLELEQRVQDRTHELQFALAQLQHKNQILEKMALTDALTGMPNRRAIELIARKELLRRTRAPAPLGFGLIDADRFKQINSTYLLSGGDHVLTWLGQILQSATRAADSIGRVGGEEFMVVAPNTDLEGAAVLAERLRVTVEQGRTSYRNQHIPVTVSVGFAVAGAATSVGYEQLREQAAAALADAKAQGRNQCVIRQIG